MAKMFTDSSPKLTNVVITEVENTLKTNPDIRAHIEKRITLITDDVLKDDKTKELIIKSLTTECKTKVNPMLQNPVAVPNSGGSFATGRVSSEEASVPSSPLPNSSGGRRSPSELVVGGLSSPLPALTNGGTRKRIMIKHRMCIPIRNSKNTARRQFIKYKREISLPNSSGSKATSLRAPSMLKGCDKRSPSESVVRRLTFRVGTKAPLPSFRTTKKRIHTKNRTGKIPRMK